MTGPVLEFEAHRSHMFGLAYRMLGTAHDAEDIVQDTYLRWQGVDREHVRNASAWLAKVVTNLCLNRLTSARAARECYIGPWLPEPVHTDALGPLETAQQRESVSFAFLVLLERLTPAERAVFVLREAFGYGHREIADTLDVSEANSRQLYRRARARIAEDNPRSGTQPRSVPTASTASTAPAASTARTASTAPAASTASTASTVDSAELVRRFLAAARDGDLAGLEKVLAADVTSWADGGGAVTVARRPTLGRDRVLRYLLGGLRWFSEELTLAEADLNGQSAVVASIAGRLVGVMLPEVVDGRISVLRIVANPAKLAGLSHPGGLAGS